MKVDVSTLLDCSAAKAWNEVQKSSLLRHVIWPLARFVPTGTSFPERWSEGLVLRCKLFVFGVIAAFHACPRSVIRSHPAAKGMTLIARSSSTDIGKLRPRR